MNRTLTPFEQNILLDKGTERPHTGLYTTLMAPGSYHCKACNAKLYESEHKFESHCGWPSFDLEVSGAVRRTPDADGRRVEIVCAACNAHLGHVFEGENMTPRNTRHCVNSVSLAFVPKPSEKYKKALFASGCFWGTEYFMARVPGVIQTMVGYAGGHVANPSYKMVCTGTTGHLECVEVTYDPGVIDYERLCRVFFETHDFSQTDGQGPDIGSQYLSAVFCADDGERAVVESLIGKLREMGHSVATRLRGPETFWPGEPEHRQYYERQGSSPYCHRYRQIFPPR